LFSWRAFFVLWADCLLQSYGSKIFYLASFPNLSKGVGYFFAAEALAKEVELKNPDVPIHFFIFSVSGTKYIESQEAKPAGNYSLTPLLGYVGWKRFFSKISPENVVFIRGELWPGAVVASGAASRNFLVNYHKPRSNAWYHKWVLSKFEKVFAVGSVPNELKRLVTENCGDTKFDSFEPKPAATPKFICIGSAWEADIEFLFSGPNFKPSHKVLIFPHDISPANIQTIKKALQAKSLSSTEFKTMAEVETENLSEIGICTSLGILRSAYQNAAKAYVGGGLRHKLHNVLEPLAYGVPTAIGPRHGNSPEALLFKSKSVLTVLHSSSDADDFLSGPSSTEYAENQKVFFACKGASRNILVKIMGESLA
jgi:3-deoxy-D-manno-octulosonic-acid transferase